MNSREKINWQLILRECSQNIQKLISILFQKLIYYLINIRNLSKHLIIVKRKSKGTAVVF
jgi:hypothetical protein